MLPNLSQDEQARERSREGRRPDKGLGRTLQTNLLYIFFQTGKIGLGGPGPGSSILPRRSSTVSRWGQGTGSGEQGGSEGAEARGSVLLQTSSAGTSTGKALGSQIPHL